MKYRTYRDLKKTPWTPGPERARPLLVQQVPPSPRGADITVVIPAYKSSKYLKECLGSLDHPGISRILVGIDDCPETMEYFRDNQDLPDNLEVYYFSGCGPYVIRNTLGFRTITPYILFFDADDYFLDGGLETLYEHRDRADMIKLRDREFTDRPGKARSFINRDRVCKGQFLIKRDVFRIMGGFQPWKCAADAEFLERYKHTSFTDTTAPGRVFAKRKHADQLTSGPVTGMRSVLRKQYHARLKDHTDHPLLKDPAVNREFSLVHRGPGIERVLAVCVAVYKAGDWIEQCVRSILGQKLPEGWRMDLRIGVDGCGSSREALDRMDIDYRFSPENKGTYVIFNSLVRQGPADAFTFFGADDVMCPDYFIHLLGAWETHSIVSPYRIQCDEDLKPYRKPLTSNGIFILPGDLMDLAGGFRTYRCACDSDLRARAEIIAGERRVYEPKACFHRRKHPDSLTNREDTGNKSPYRVKALKEMEEKRSSGDIRIIYPETVPMEMNRINMKVLSILTTKACNLDCKECMARGWRKSEPMWEQDPEGIKVLIKALEDENVCFDLGCLSGGEPLLNPGLGEIIGLMASSDRFGKLQIQTNGVAVNRGNCGELDEILAPVDIIRISMYTTNPQSRKIREMLPRADKEKRIKFVDRTTHWETPRQGYQNALPAKCRCAGTLGFSRGRLWPCNGLVNTIYLMGWDPEDYYKFTTVPGKDPVRPVLRMDRFNQDYCRYCAGNSKVIKHLKKIKE